LNWVRSGDERGALAAFEALLSRVYSRPAQQVDATIKTASLGQAHLQALQADPHLFRPSCLTGAGNAHADRGCIGGAGFHARTAEA